MLCMRVPLRKTRLHNFFSNSDTHKRSIATHMKFYIGMKWGNQSKIGFGHNFWLEGPIDLRPTRLNCILQDLFRDTPLDLIWRAQICTQICIFGIFGHIWHIWARQIWSSGVSLKRSCKMKFRPIDLGSIVPPSQKLWPNLNLANFSIIEM